jgi:hypothetical protein
MDRFHIYTRWGAAVSQPSVEQMRAALAELDAEDVEQPDTSLEHESGWGLSAFGSGALVWENVESDELPRHMKGLTRERVLELWLKLAAGKIAEIDEEPWLPGYGSPPVTDAERAELEAVRLRLDRELYDSFGDERSDTPCARERCPRGAITASLFCRVHHFEMLLKRACPFSD